MYTTNYANLLRQLEVYESKNTSDDDKNEGFGVVEDCKWRQNISRLQKCDTTHTK